ncbi:hypothetical protein XELAEV_18020019mg [Xenopus laevis]|uniref:Reverse transcriptase domain-containing protein n=1 Tax=Xenopus laevis TaxID=8355 RepID=A0A974HQ32_XENLA|nr:hypothetical protein XELAEV_18020019mg [Xenopus laevis]
MFCLLCACYYILCCNFKYNFTVDVCDCLYENNKNYFGKKTFTKLDTTFRQFIWANFHPRLTRGKLQGGVAFPNLFLHYLATQLSHVASWVVEARHQTIPAT